MNRFGNWLRQTGMGLAAGLRRFMTGRYGTDRLNMTILVTSLILCMVGMFVRNPAANMILFLLSYGLMIWAIFRSLSRNTYRRYQENRSFLLLLDQLKDREHRYYTCPKCRQIARVPRKKGKIAITCPKCGERFVRKT